MNDLIRSMDDCISRDISVKALRKEVQMSHDDNDEQTYFIDADDAIETLEHLPPAQPNLTELIMQTYLVSEEHAKSMKQILYIIADNYHTAYANGINSRIVEKVDNSPRF